MKKDDCIFCRIAAGEISSDTVYEDDDFRVILDLNPGSRGHMLIIPKEHYQDIYELSDECGMKLMAVAKKMAVAAKKALKADGINLVQNNEEAAGQSVPHFHIHIIPRKKGDGIDAWPAFSGARRNLKEVYEELRMPGDTVESG